MILSQETSASADPVALLQALVRCASVTPKEAGAQRAVQTFLKQAGFAVTPLVFEGDGSYRVDNLFATYGSGGKHILFGGHTDVVPTGELSAWTHAPFDGVIENDILFGRGAVDMKSGVATFCVAAAEVAKQLGRRAGAGQISLAITNDEEADAINGTEKILQWATEQGHVFDFAIVGEPSSKEIFADSIKIGRRGSLNGTVLVHGKQGHAAYPERAHNPVPVIARIAAALDGYAFDDGSEHFEPTNLEVTSIDVGNSASNVIPMDAKLTFNVRFNDHWTETNISHQISDLVERVDANGCAVSWSQLSRAAQSFVSPVSDDIQHIIGAITAATGTAPELGTFGGTSDARFVAQYCPVVECGLVGTSMHEINERVPVADVHRLTVLYLDILRRFFQL